MIHFIKLGFAPGDCEFVSKVNSFSPVLAVAELPAEEEQEPTGAIRLVKVEQVSTKHDQNQIVQSTVIEGLHESQVRLIKFNQELDLVVSTDQAGNIEIWDPETHEMPEDSRLQFELMSETDYYTLAAEDTFALSMEFSPDWKLLAIFCRDCKIRVFHFASGRLITTIDESVEALTLAQNAEEPDAMILIADPAEF